MMRRTRTSSAGAGSVRLSLSRNVPNKGQNGETKPLRSACHCPQRAAGDTHSALDSMLQRCSRVAVSLARKRPKLKPLGARHRSTGGRRGDSSICTTRSASPMSSHSPREVTTPDGSTAVDQVSHSDNSPATRAPLSWRRNLSTLRFAIRPCTRYLLWRGRSRCVRHGDRGGVRFHPPRPSFRASSTAAKRPRDRTRRRTRSSLSSSAACRTSSTTTRSTARVRATLLSSGRPLTLRDRQVQDSPAEAVRGDQSQRLLFLGARCLTLPSCAAPTSLRASLPSG